MRQLTIDDDSNTFYSTSNNGVFKRYLPSAHYLSVNELTPVYIIKNVLSHRPRYRYYDDQQGVCSGLNIHVDFSTWRP